MTKVSTGGPKSRKTCYRACQIETFYFQSFLINNAAPSKRENTCFIRNQICISVIRISIISFCIFVFGFTQLTAISEVQWFPDNGRFFDVQCNTRKNLQLNYFRSIFETEKHQFYFSKSNICLKGTDTYMLSINLLQKFFYIYIYISISIYLYLYLYLSIYN